MENIEDNMGKTATEHPEGVTDAALEIENYEQLKEQYKSFQVQHMAAMEASDELKAREIEVKIDELALKLGLDEERHAA